MNVTNVVLPIFFLNYRIKVLSVLKNVNLDLFCRFDLHPEDSDDAEKPISVESDV